MFCLRGENMGQHKHNPTAIAAAKGELPPKPKKLSKRESERILYAKCQEILYKRFSDTYEKIQETDYYKG
jgi:hypothetical protein